MGKCTVSYKMKFRSLQGFKAILRLPILPGPVMSFVRTSNSLKTVYNIAQMYGYLCANMTCLL